MPAFLRRPDPDWRAFSASEVTALMELRPMRWDRADTECVQVNNGYGDEPWTVEDACEYAETLARRELRHAGRDGGGKR